MALQTDLNIFPYYDDYDPNKNFYRVLFRPGVAVQARELNQLQTILQNQIERFGDNIFKRGTIIEGCNIVRHDALPYVKIKDVETDGTQINVSLFDNLSVRNSSNVTAYIVKTAAGFESRSPDLNTLFVKYNSSGTDSNTSTFAASDVLTIYSQDYPIFKTRVNNGSSLVSNTDSVVFVSALAVTNSTGGNTFPVGAFASGHTIQNGVANLVIIEANATANAEVLILKVRPYANNLADGTANTTKWRFGVGESIRNATTANTANVVSVIGTGAVGSLVTDSLGKVLSINVTTDGTGYYVPPHVTVMKQTTSSLSATEIADLDVAALNYLAIATVANSALTPIGVGYGVTVDEGVIYQKGFFSRVSQQLVVVNKYSNTAFTKSVGFYTTEDIIDSNEDTSLLDNATGTYNYAAPGADRLKLTPELRVFDKTEADANTEFLPIIEFADGRPYKQNLNTVYNVIGDEIARRTYEESGNYVLDQFIVGTKDSDTFADTSTVFKIVIDPGKAYINGYRVETNNYLANVAKGVTTASNPQATISLGYGSYLKVKELGGNFAFNLGSQVDLHDTAATYITSNAGNAISAPGNKIGEARVRSLTLESGEPGAPDAVYKLYLFDIVMSAGKNFGNVRSVYYGGTNKGIADVKLTNGAAYLEEANSSYLLYSSVPAMKSVTNITYTYRTINETETANTTGFIELNLGSDTYFPYTGALSESAAKDLLVIPKADYQASANATGTIEIGGGANTANLTVAGAGGTNFLNTFSSGDFVKFANSTGGTTVISQVAEVTGASSMILVSGPGQSYSGGTVKLYFPSNVPISLTNKPGRRYANVSVSNSQVMTISLANTIANSTGGTSSANVMVVYNAVRNNVSSAVKTGNRSVFTRVVCSNNAGGVRGPWALGLSDAFRLRKVYQANGASRAVTFDANTGVASNFITLANNAFANGDAVLYLANTTVIGGLANNTTYYAVYANSTGTALASTRGGANIALTASTTAENHTLTGQPIFFTANTIGVLDITNDFYIDTNQKEDYLDTSYLYRKPRATTLSSNDILLIQYDVFTGGDTGVKTISSYTIDDTLNFTALSAQSNVHTLELPEVNGTAGRYYDIRDQYDFRPKSANTIDLITEISTVAAGANAASIINPTEPTSANRFSASEKYFPAPNTTLTANIQYYLGRTERVCIDSSGEYLLRSGKAGLLTDIAPEPKDSITLDILKIPAYPSLPAAKSADITKIMDTKVANETYSKRIDKYTVTNTIDAISRARIQHKGYKMSDISSLEHRIATLEYYVGFTLAEALAKARFIPSSLDSLTDRFRFGFFVDPFTDYNYCDLTNPEFFATITEDQLGPRMTEINIEFKPENSSLSGVVTLPYNEFTIVAQNDATDGPVRVANTTPAANTTGPVTVTTVTQRTSVVLQAQRSTSHSDSGYVYEDFFYTFSSLVGPVELYINSRDNNMAMEIFQATTEGGTYKTTYTSASAEPITTTDMSAKSLYLNGRQIEHPGEFRKKSYGPVGGFLEDQFKMLWTHNPNDGVYYKIRVYKGDNHGASGQAGTFEYKMYYPTDVVTSEVRTVPNPATFGYIGIVNQILPSSFTINLSKQFFYVFGASIPSGTYISDAQKFTLAASGLKPNTYHKFIFDGTDKTAKCSQNRTSTTNTSGLLSDANGVINFDFYYDAGIDEATTDVEQQNKLASATAGTKVFTIQSYDGNSKATGSIGLKYYTNIDFTSSTALSGLNITQTATMSSTQSAQTTATSTTSTLSQSINNAIDLNNIQINRDILNNLWFL